MLIENQLEKTDHRHLGQVMTYAAGLDAVTIIWIATDFADEHRATIDWLNKVSDDQFRFFGLQIEAWRIGDSDIAPRFNMIAKPNTWSKKVAAARNKINISALTETKKLQLEFWEILHQELAPHPFLRTQKPRPRHWANSPIGCSDVRLGSLIVSRENQIGVEVYMSGETAKDYFNAVYEMRDEIEQELGFTPDWRPLPDRKASKIVLIRGDAPLQDRTAWPSYRDWFIENLEKFYTVFNPRLRILNLDEDEETDGNHLKDNEI